MCQARRQSVASSLSRLLTYGFYEVSEACERLIKWNFGRPYFHYGHHGYLSGLRRVRDSGARSGATDSKGLEVEGRACQLLEVG